MSDDPAPSFGAATEQAMAMLDAADPGDTNEPSPIPETTTPETPQAEPEAQPETPAPEVPPPTQVNDDPVSEWEIDGAKYPLTQSQVKLLLRHGAAKLRELQDSANRGPEPQPEPEPAPEPVVDTFQGIKLTEEMKQNPFVQLLMAQQAKLDALDKGHRQTAAQMREERERAEAKAIVDDTLSTMKKNDFFKDASPDEQHEYLGEILMLRGVNKHRGMTTEEAVRHIAGRYERKISARTEKWKQSKIAAAGQKVEGGGTTHATPPKKFKAMDLFNGNSLAHAMDLVRGLKSES